MRSTRLKLRLVAWLATSSLCLTAVAPAFAQPAAPDGEDQAGDQGTDPPALAGRIAALSGSVSFHAAGETQWVAATLNYPVTTGSAFWTEPQATATLEVADSRLVMDGSTELDIATLDQNTLAATEPQGAVFLDLPSVPSSQGVSFDTPRGTVQISAPGRYEIVAGDTGDATSVTVVEGAAHVTGTNLSLDIGPQQTATIDGADTLQGRVGAMRQDAFLRSQLTAPVRRVVAALPTQARYMTGAADLQQYGDFSQTAQYGQVWYPNDVSRDWAPYREGHWAYVQPWGWTWVDNARWGFAPFHYGRWVQVNDRWGWVAGSGEAADVSAYPVYSPALVSFVDVGGVALAGAAIGFAVGGYAPAWIPLGPREPYYPWYHCRPDYFGRVNRFYGVPRDIIARGPTYIDRRQVTFNQTNIFINRRAATISPADAFARGRPLMGVARPLPERFLAQARPVIGRLPVRPTAFTPNLSPAAARRFNVALPMRPVRSAMPGPRIPPSGAGRPRPLLRPGALPGNARPGPERGFEGRPGVSGPGMPSVGNRPGEGGPAIAPGGVGRLPALRAPGGRPDRVAPGSASAGAERGRAEPNQGVGAGGIRREQGGNPGAGAGPSAPGQRVRSPDARPVPAASSTRPAGMQAPRPEPRSEVRRPEPASQTPRPMVRPAAPKAERPRTAARPEAPRPSTAPRAEEPRRPAPRTEFRPAPRMEAPRPAPRAEAPRQPPSPKPAPRPEPPQGKHQPH